MASDANPRDPGRPVNRLPEQKLRCRARTQSGKETQRFFLTPNRCRPYTREAKDSPLGLQRYGHWADGALRAPAFLPCAQTHEAPRSTHPRAFDLEFSS